MELADTGSIIRQVYRYILTYLGFFILSKIIPSDRVCIG